MTSITRNILGAAIVALLSALVVQGSPAAMIKDGDVIRRGKCSGASSWKLKLSPEDGKIEVEFEVDQNRNRRRWQVVMRDNGARFFRGKRITRAPSGSFSVRALANNRRGADRIVVTGRNLRTGNTSEAWRLSNPPSRQETPAGAGLSHRVMRGRSGVVGKSGGRDALGMHGVGGGLVCHPNRGPLTARLP
jgi:hypothetical protein